MFWEVCFRANAGRKVMVLVLSLSVFLASIGSGFAAEDEFRIVNRRVSQDLTGIVQATEVRPSHVNVPYGDGLLAQERPGIERRQEDVDVLRREEEERRRKAEEEAARKVKSASLIATGKTIKLVGILTGIAVAGGLTALAIRQANKGKDEAAILGPAFAVAAGAGVGVLIWVYGDSVEESGRKLAIQVDPSNKSVGLAYVHRF